MTSVPSQRHPTPQLVRSTNGLATSAEPQSTGYGHRVLTGNTDGFATPVPSPRESTSRCVPSPREFATVSTPRSLEQCEFLRSTSVASFRPADGFAWPAPSRRFLDLSSVTLHSCVATGCPASPSLTSRDATPLVRPYGGSVNVPSGCSTPTPPALGPPPTPGYVTTALPGCGMDGLKMDDLQIGSEGFDPNQPALKSQITSKLSVAGGSAIAALHGSQGGLNEGVWMLRDPCSGTELVMKLVKGERGEADRYLKLAQSHPSIVSDSSLSFPFRVFRCLRAGCGRAYDLLVMRRASGQRLDHLIAEKVSNGRTADLSKVFENVGASLAELHKRYGNSQHGDCQPSNVYYNDTTSQVTFIDVSDLGLPSLESDTEHFTEALRLLSRHYGQQFLTASLHDFEAGYFRDRHRLSNL